MRKKIERFVNSTVNVSLPTYLLLNVIIALDIVIFIIEQVGGK